MRMRHILFNALHSRHHQHDSLHHAFGFDPGRDEGDRHQRHAGRGFGGRGGGDFFAGFSEMRGGGRRGGGRMFGHGDLKLLLLALIEQQPRHGYELIRIIEDMFHGHYSPSPGAIYPTLTMLEELGTPRSPANRAAASFTPSPPLVEPISRKTATRWTR